MKNEDFTNYKNKLIENIDARRCKDSSEKEKWIVKSFLKILNISYFENEIIKLPQNDKIDINFRDINFQVKTIIFPEEYKPNDEDKILKEVIQKTNNIAELNEKMISLKN